MPIARHLVRRHAVYYWRRRIPRTLATCCIRPHLLVSLLTREPARARSIAAQLDAVFEILMMSSDAQFLTKKQIDGILRSVVEEHLAKLDRVAAAGKTAPFFDAGEAAFMDRRVAWVYRLLDAQGADAVAHPDDRAAMTQAGLTEKDIGFVDQHLEVLRINGLVPTPRSKLEALVAAQGAQPTTMNVALAQQAYYRGMSLALFETTRRYAGAVPDAADIVAAALRVDRTEVAAPVSAHVQPAVPAMTPAVETPAEPVSDPVIADDIVAVGERFIGVKAQDENWDPGTQDQARQTFALFNRYLAEERKIRGFASLRQSDLASFVTFLRTEIYKFYGKSPRDQTRTIVALREIAATKAETLRGLVGATLNRHLGHIAQLARHARAQGIRIDRDLDFGDLRAEKPKNTRNRDERKKMPLAVTQRVFHAAHFIGSAAWDRPYEFKEGGLVFHRALYFVPMLLEYTGTRREESCGLCVDDIHTDGLISYIHIGPNEFRRIKNPQSVRDIPLHPELLRLNFLKYVDFIRSLGYRRVFPDLYSPTSKSPLGDRFYDEFMPVLEWACKIEGVDLEFVLHSIRHGFNSQLKAAFVHAEERADLMGHGGDSETTERYAEPIRLQRALDLLQKLPVVTAHLQPQPIRLLPWVEQNEDAPFSRGRGRKKRA